jgi:hypothetical protein
MLEVETLRVPTIDLPAARRREAVSNGPLVAVYATRSDDRLVLFVISRRVPGYPYMGHDGSTTVTVHLPITRAKSVTRISQSGDWKSHNVDSGSTRLVSENVPVPETLPILTVPSLPPGETMIFVFDGTVQAK